MTICKEDIEGLIMCPELSAAAQEITVAASSATHNSALTVGEYYMLSSSTACRVLQGNFGATTALASSTYLPANYPIYIGVPDASKDGVAAIQESAGGKLTITQMKPALGG